MNQVDVPEIACVGYLGATKDDHFHNFLRLMTSTGIKVVVLQDSVSDRPSQSSESSPLSAAMRRSRRVLDQLNGTANRETVRRLLDIIDDNELKCIVAYWGTRPMADIIAIKKHRPSVRIILNILCHPVALSRGKVALQNWYFGLVSKFCDGLIVSSEAMRRYLTTHVLGRRSVPMLTWPPYYSEHYYPFVRYAPCNSVPNLLFLGRVDWRRAQPSDNALPFLRELMDCGVHVYYHYAPESTINHENAHTFEYMPLREVTAYATQFDISLIMYNLEACGRADRFDITVPDRLLASVIAGVPIAIPATGYRACREYLTNYKAVVPFQTPAELANYLRDRQAVAGLRQLAEERSRHYAGERHMETLLRFLSTVTATGRATSGSAREA